jgi:hypothetical protein
MEKAHAIAAYTRCYVLSGDVDSRIRISTLQHVTEGSIPTGWIIPEMKDIYLMLATSSSTDTRLSKHFNIAPIRGFEGQREDEDDEEDEEDEEDDDEDDDEDWTDTEGEGN